MGLILLMLSSFDAEGVITGVTLGLGAVKRLVYFSRSKILINNHL